MNCMEESHGQLLRRLTFELTGAPRRAGLTRVATMYRVPTPGPSWHAAGRPVERGVRPRAKD